MRTRTVDLDIGLSDLEGDLTLSQMERWVASVGLRIPAEFRDQPVFHFDDDRDDGWTLTVRYERPETDLDRQEDERKLRDCAAQKYNAEYALYMKLKTKFE